MITPLRFIEYRRVATDLYERDQKEIFRTIRNMTPAEKEAEKILWNSVEEYFTTPSSNSGK